MIRYIEAKPLLSDLTTAGLRSARPAHMSVATYTAKSTWVASGLSMRSCDASVTQAPRRPQMAHFKPPA
jgi:hypothetical protein